MVMLRVISTARITQQTISEKQATFYELSYILAKCHP